MNSINWWNKRGSDNSKISDPPQLILQVSGKINLKSDNSVALLSLGIYYTWKNIKKSNKNNKFKISAATWNKEFGLSNGQGDDYTTGCLPDYSYFEKQYKMIAIDLSKQKALDSDPKAMQQINFTEHLSGTNKRLTFFVIE